MKRLRPFITIAAICGVALTALIGLFWWLTLGVATISGETANIVEAALVNGGARQKMERRDDGSFRAIVKLEGSIEVVCRNGEREQASYVTPHMSTKLVAKSDGDCVTLDEVT